jgi:hypothetical protein
VVSVRLAAFQPEAMRQFGYLFAGNRNGSFHCENGRFLAAGLRDFAAALGAATTFFAVFAMWKSS